MLWPDLLKDKILSLSWTTPALFRMMTSMPKGKIEINKWKMPVKIKSQVKMKKMKVVAIRTEIETEMKEEEKTRMNQEKTAKMKFEVITKAPEVEVVHKGTKEIELIETETIKMTMLEITMEVTSARKRKRGKQ